MECIVRDKPENIQPVPEATLQQCGHLRWDADGDSEIKRYIANADVNTKFNRLKWMLIETDHPEAPMVEMRVRHQWSMLPHQFRDYQVRVQFDGYIANVGVLPRNGSREFNVELKNFKGRRLLALSSLDPRFKVRLVGTKSGDDTRVRVTGAITDAAGAPGAFICPVVFATPEGTETMYVIGTVR